MRSQKVAGIITGLGLTVTTIAVGSQNCLPTQVELVVTRNSNHEAVEAVCLNSASYGIVKSMLLTEYRTIKVDEEGNRYDFNINNRELLESVLAHELAEDGGLTLEDFSPEQLRAELTNLLTKAKVKPKRPNPVAKEGKL